MRYLLLWLPFISSPLIARPELPALPDTLILKEWTLTGPFPAAPREGALSGILDPSIFWASPGDTFRTSLTQGGLTVSRRIQADSLGWLQTHYENIHWDTIQNYLGVAGLLNTGFAGCEFSSPYSCRALAVATKLGGFTLNGRSYVGDVYGNGWFLTPVLIESGINRVVLRLSGFGNQRARFMLIPPQNPIELVLADATVPDLLPDSAMDIWLGIPLLNTTNGRLDNVKLDLLLDSLLLESVTLPSIPALGGMKHPLLLHIPALSEDSSGLKLTIRTSWCGFSRLDTLCLEYRKPDQPHRSTFLSAIDSSCQYYGILYPRGFDHSRRYSLILALHGAGVEAGELVRCYRARDWTFVITPTNRRPYGFDWQDWGRLDALEVLDLALARLPVDPDRIYLTGHSMGGHGAWHISTLHPDRFAAVSPHAGWPTHQLYVPWFMQRSASLAQPAQLAVRDRVLRSDNAPALLGNCINLPFFIVHGSDDDNVPPLHSRSLATVLHELDVEHTYREIPGRKHWWNWNDSTPCVDFDEMMRFFQTRTRQAGPRHVRFRTPDLGTTRSAYWVTIDRVATVGDEAEIEATAGESLISVRTVNVSQFTLRLDGRLFFRSKVRITIDGTPLGSRFSLPAVRTFHKTRYRWQ
ncbi:MAG: prolyl oligopeptidase family serine peptidase [candidate division WOR-3 bacterium]